MAGAEQMRGRAVRDKVRGARLRIRSWGLRATLGFGFYSDRVGQP